MRRNYSENAQRITGVPKDRSFEWQSSDKISSEYGLDALVDADMGGAPVPRSISTPQTVAKMPIKGLDLRRTVYLYGAAV